MRAASMARRVLARHGHATAAAASASVRVVPVDAVVAWAASGAMALTGRPDGPGLGPPEPLVGRLTAWSAMVAADGRCPRAPRGRRPPRAAGGAGRGRRAPAARDDELRRTRRGCCPPPTGGSPWPWPGRTTSRPCPRGCSSMEDQARPTCGTSWSRRSPLDRRSSSSSAPASSACPSAPSPGSGPRASGSRAVRRAARPGPALGGGAGARPGGGHRRGSVGAVGRPAVRASPGRRRRRRDQGRVGDPP